jgi:glycosyltransferase involved in cell wall biosynthesis
MGSNRSAPAGGSFHRRFTDYSGLFYDEFAPESAWIREEARLRLPPLDGIDALVLSGEYRPHPDARGWESGCPVLTVAINGVAAGRVAPAAPGPWELRLPLATSARTEHPLLTLTLSGTGATNVLAWSGRRTGLKPLQRFRRQNKNRQLRVARLATPEGDNIYDFSARHSPLCRPFLRRHARLGLNVVGFLTADLGVGESARCMVRAADAAGLPTALVPLKLNCRNPLGDMTYAGRLRSDNPLTVNVIHLDPPACRDIDHHHGAGFRSGKYNVAYFAWELTEFPDAWVENLDYFDEVWCPSDFTRKSIAVKSPWPVLTMPHAIGFARPPGSAAELRGRFGLPTDGLLFLTLFDLNSYAARKNPAAALAAFALSGLGGAGAHLVVKVHNTASNPDELRQLEEHARSIAGIILLTGTLSREETYALEAACDCLISLHRSEGFGLVVAECMYLGKPVVATNWSATAEFLDADNGCPVAYELATLSRNQGPYPKGAHWAEADVAHAAQYLRGLAADPAYGQRLGAAARATIERRFAPSVIGQLYRQRLEAIATF